MSRRALIISNPGEPGAENYCEGVNKDVTNYKNFLRSPYGGYWYENEITCLNRPSKTVLDMHMDELKNFDFTIVIFCGHGYSNYGDTILELGKNVGLYADSLKKGAIKRIIILDCCRKHAEIINESIIHAYSARLDSSTNGPAARKYYDELISQCSNGVVVTYACDLNETAGDDSRHGGYYSYSLLKGANAWASGYHYYDSSLSIVKAHEQAAKLTENKSGGQQHPQIEKPRSAPYFPFAVSL